MSTDFKQNDIIKLTNNAISENIRIFKKEALFRNEKDKKYRVSKVVEDKQNNLQIVFVTDLKGNTIPKFNCGIFAGHLELFT